MSNSDSSSTVSIVFKGSAQSVEDAIKRVSGQLGSLDRTATEASAGLHKTASAEAEVEAEAKGLTRGMEVAADAMALMSKESAEATRRLYEVRSLASDMRGAFSSMGSAIVGGAAAFAGVAAIGFMSGAVKEALAGEQAQAKLNAALRGNKDQIEQVNKSAEDGATTWAKYGVTVGNLKGILANALGKGIDPSMILGNAKGLADLKVALGTDIPGAIDAVTNGPKSAKALSRALNLNKQDAMNLALAMNTAYTANARMAVALQFTEKSRFAGQGDALAGTDTGKMLQFQTSMKDLQETLGQGVIPLMGNFASALNGMVQAANSLLAGVGGLSGILSSKWVPIIALSLVGLKGFLGVVNLIEGLFRTKFVSTLMGTRQEIDQGARATADYVKALDDIPTDVTTVAAFDDAAAVAVKEPYIANVQSVPTAVTTTATFVPAGNVAAMTDAQIAAAQAEATAHPIVVPAQMGTVTGVATGTADAVIVPVRAGAADTGGIAADQAAMQAEATAHPVSVPVTAGAYSGPSMASIVGATALTATVSTVIMSPDAQKALGHLFTGQGTVTGWTTAPGAPVPTVTAEGHITDWKNNKGVHAPAVNVTGHITSWVGVHGVRPPVVNVTGHITDWTNNKGVHAPAVTVAGHITSWATVHGVRPPVVNVTGHITHLDIAKGTPLPTVSTGETVHITGAVHVKATADITTATVPKGTHLIVPAGISVNGVTVPKGTALAVDVHGRITSVDFPTDKHGHRLTYNVPLHAKVQVDAGALSSALGTSKNPLKMYVQPVLPKGYHLPATPTTPHGGDTGAGNLGMTIAQTVLSAIISGAIMARFLRPGGGATPEGNNKFLDGIAKALSDSATAKVSAKKNATLGETLDSLLRSPTSDMSPKQIDELFGAVEAGAAPPPGPAPTKPRPLRTKPKTTKFSDWGSSDEWSGPPDKSGIDPNTFVSLVPKGGPQSAAEAGFMSSAVEMLKGFGLMFGGNQDTARYKDVYGAHGQVVGYRGLTPAENKAADKADATHLQSQWSWLTASIRNLVYTPLMAIVGGIKGLGPAIGSIITGALSHIPDFGLGTNKSNPAFVNGQWVGTGQNAYRTHDANLHGPPSAEHGFAREFLADKNNQNGSWFYIRNGQHPPTGWHQTGGTAGFLRATGGLTGTGGLATTLADIIAQSGGTKGGALGSAGRAVGHSGNITINQTINGGAHDPQTIAHLAGIEARKVLGEFVGAL